MDKEKINNKLDELSSYYDELMEDFPKKKEFTGNRLARRGIEKTIELIADTIIDISNILISELKLKKPADSRSSIDTISEKEVISKKLCSRIKDLISFRNIIAHRYAKLDNEEEFEHIDENHEDIEKFIEEVDKFVKGF